MATKVCTPFCDPKKPCPKHHDLLVAALNCSDRRDQSANAAFEHFQATVKDYLNKGWKMDEDVPDPSRNYRYPLLHWVAVLGKCRAMEWMINFGFNVTVCSSASQESALHRCVQYLHISSMRRHSEKITRTVHLLKDCLLIQDGAMQTPLHLAAEKMLTGNKSDYFSEWLETMVNKAKNMPGKTADILNAKDHLGNTALHYLAQNEIGFVSLFSIVSAGGDVTITNNKNLNPLNVAMNSGSTRIIKLLSSVSERKQQGYSGYENDIYTTDSPPESPVNILENTEDENDDSDRRLCYYSNGADNQLLEHSENSSSICASIAEDSTEDIARHVASVASNETQLSITDASGDNSHSWKQNSPTGNTRDNDLLHKKIGPANSETLNDGPSTPEAEPCPPCHRDATVAHCQCNCANVEMPVIYPYTSIVHIKQEKLDSCERCQQESVAEMSSSSELHANSGKSVLSLLQGAGLLQNLTQIAEKKRNEDELVLTDKMELVKETNNQLELGEKEIDEKSNRIASLTTELEQLKQELKRKSEEQERLHLKRRHLNEECIHLQKKLRCCDSLLKFVPK